MKQTIKIKEDQKVFIMLNDEYQNANQTITKDVNALLAKALAKNNPETFAWYGFKEAKDELYNDYQVCVFLDDEDKHADRVRTNLMLYRIGVPHMLEQDYGIVGNDFNDYHKIYIDFYSELVTTDSDVREEIARLEKEIEQLKARLA